MKKIFYAQNRRSGGAYLRRFLENEYKDKCFVGFPSTQKELDFILSDNCLCFCSHIQLDTAFPEKAKKGYLKLFEEYNKSKTFGITIIRHPVKRFYSGIQRQASLLNNPANSNNHGRFSHLSRIYGPYTKNFMFKNQNPSEFHIAPFSIIIKDILSNASDQRIEDTVETMWLYESLHTISLGNIAEMESCLNSKPEIINTPISTLPKSIKNIISKRFNLVGAQENNESYLSKLIDDGILSKKTVEDHREIFPKISTSTPIDETIDPDLLYEWYLRFPYDFALWSWAIKNGNL